MSDPEDKTGEVTIHGGVVHCPGGHRGWTVSLLDGKLKIFCTGCKRCFVLHKQWETIDSATETGHESEEYVLDEHGHRPKFVNVLDLK